MPLAAAKLKGIAGLWDAFTPMADFDAGAIGARRAAASRTAAGRVRMRAAIAQEPPERWLPLIGSGEPAT